MNTREWARNPGDMVSRKPRGNVFREESSTVSDAVDTPNRVHWIGSFHLDLV